jgi:hypothetical protein
MASLSDLDTLSESEYDSSEDSTSEMDEDCNDETLEPERDATNLVECENAPWDPTAQLYTTQSFPDIGHLRSLTYELYQTMCSPQSTISSYFGD